MFLHRTLLFVDDQILLAEDEDDALLMRRKLHDKCRNLGLSINIDKTQYLVVSRDACD